ncbi:MAG TPA: helix-turn-helix transcriptional regulator [Opitutales bacterium]|jgi:transcriptional regulator with XRE-family HTH domain|nr:helix-turn-helix transcriptional regulator [Opitutales bacterium]
MNAHINLRRNAKRLRVAQGLSQEDVAERAKLGYKHYQKIESGNWGDLYLGTVEAIARALGVTMGCLLDAPPQGEANTANLPSGRPRKRVGR